MNVVLNDFVPNYYVLLNGLLYQYRMFTNTLYVTLMVLEVVFLKYTMHTFERTHKHALWKRQTDDESGDDTRGEKEFHWERGKTRVEMTAQKFVNHRPREENRMCF